MVLVFAVAVAPAAAQAKEQDSRVSAWVTAGSLGIGPELAYRAAPVVGVRGGAAFLGFDHDIAVDDINYHGAIKLASLGADLDLYPFRGGLRISAGVRIDRNKVALTATPTKSVRVGKVVYTPDQIGSLSGTARAADVAPTLTVGYAGGLTGGVKFAIDAGAMFQGHPRIDDLAATGLLASDVAFKAQLADEEAQIANKIHKYSVYPIVQLSLGYAF